MYEQKYNAAEKTMQTAFENAGGNKCKAGEDKCKAGENEYSEGNLQSEDAGMIEDAGVIEDVGMIEDAKMIAALETAKAVIRPMHGIGGKDVFLERAPSKGQVLISADPYVIQKVASAGKSAKKFCSRGYVTFMVVDVHEFIARDRAAGNKAHKVREGVTHKVKEGVTKVIELRPMDIASGKLFGKTYATKMRAGKLKQLPDRRGRKFKRRSAAAKDPFSSQDVREDMLEEVIQWKNAVRKAVGISKKAVKPLEVVYGKKTQKKYQKPIKPVEVGEQEKVVVLGKELKEQNIVRRSVEMTATEIKKSGVTYWVDKSGDKYWSRDNKRRVDNKGEVRDICVRKFPRAIGNEEGKAERRENVRDDVTEYTR